MGLNLEEIEFNEPKKRPIKKAKNKEIKLTFIVTQSGGRSLGKTSTIYIKSKTLLFFILPCR